MSDNISPVIKDIAKAVLKASAIQSSAVSLAYLSQGEPINWQKCFNIAKAECLATPLCGIVIVQLLKRAKGPLAVFIAKRMIFGVIVIYIYTFAYQLLSTKNLLKALTFDHYNIQKTYKKGWLYWNAVTLITDHLIPRRFEAISEITVCFHSSYISTIQQIENERKKRKIQGCY